MMLGKESRSNVALKVNFLIINKSARVISLGLTTDNHLTYEEDTNYLCQTANYKLHALCRIGKYLPFDKAKHFCIYNQPLQLPEADLGLLQHTRWSAL